MLTKVTTKTIYDAFENSYFTASSFKINFPSEGSIYMEATFIDNEEYCFTFSKSASKLHNGYSVDFTPGRVVLDTSYKTNKLNDVLESISSWTENIKNELRSFNPLYDEIEILKEEFNNKIEESFKDSNEQFTNEEIEKLSKKFEALNEKFNALFEKNEITDEELDKVISTLDSIKKDTEHFPKKAWYRTAGSKIMYLSSKVLTSKQGQKLLDHGADKVIDYLD